MQVGKQLLEYLISNGFQQFIGSQVAIPFSMPCPLDTVWQEEIKDPWDSYSGWLLILLLVFHQYEDFYCFANSV